MDGGLSARWHVTDMNNFSTVFGTASNNVRCRLRRVFWIPGKHDDGNDRCPSAVLPGRPSVTVPVPRRPTVAVKTLGRALRVGDTNMGMVRNIFVLPPSPHLSVSPYPIAVSTCPTKTTLLSPRRLRVTHFQNYTEAKSVTCKTRFSVAAGAFTALESTQTRASANRSGVLYARTSRFSRRGRPFNSTVCPYSLRTRDGLSAF